MIAMVVVLVGMLIDFIEINIILPEKEINNVKNSKRN